MSLLMLLPVYFKMSDNISVEWGLFKKEGHGVLEVVTYLSVKSC